MQELQLETGSGRSTIVVGDGALRTVGGALAGASSVVVVTDDNVAPLFGETVADILTQSGLMVHERTIPHGENSKSLWQAECLYDFLASKAVDRDCAVLALGGGVVSDLAGFVASTWLRGVRFFSCPTTLLAAVDAGVGGKTGLNHAGLKNVIGSFRQPERIVIDVSTLKTMEERCFRSGVAESLKHGLIAGDGFFEWQTERRESIESRAPDVLEELIARNLRIKIGIVALDERDRLGERAKLNFGHTIGHALEVASNYDLMHGECVGLGMLGATHIAVERGLADSRTTEVLRAALVDFGLPVQFSHADDISALISWMHRDEKAVAGQVRFVLPERVGLVSAGHEVGDDEMRFALGKLMA